MKFENQTIAKQNILLDGNDFVGVTFDECGIEFRGTAPVQMNGCHFQNCHWHFAGAAGEALQLLAALYKQGGGFENMIENVFDKIRNGQLAPLKH